MSLFIGFVTGLPSSLQAASRSHMSESEMLLIIQILFEFSSFSSLTDFFLPQSKFSVMQFRILQGLPIRARAI